MELLDYEKRHIDYLKKNSSECTLFLKRNGEFPLSAPTSVVLVGSGARRTIKGGTGSGDVSSRFFKSIEEALIDSGFTITSTNWLDEYDEFKKSKKKDYIKDCKRHAHKAHVNTLVYAFGFYQLEQDYDISPDYSGDVCIYVLARNSGEGNDRRNVKGDVKLTDKERDDILYLNKKFKKFMLVLNVGGVVDISSVIEVSNILLLSQLGVVTGEVFVDTILGKCNPSGKLSTTWAKTEYYPSFSNFGDQDDTYYKEGIYVGYRYFNTIGKDYLFPFGFGLSYTDFSIGLVNASIDKNLLKVNLKVTNIGKFCGKEVVQAYVTKPNGYIDNPYIELCGYYKTRELAPNEAQLCNIIIDFTKLWCYDEARCVKFLPKGDYIIRIGNSSINLKTICKCILPYEVILEKLENKCFDKELVDLKLDRKDEAEDVLEFTLDLSSLKTKEIEYKKDTYRDKLIESLDEESLAKLCLGNYENGLAALVGSSCRHVVGGAGETALCVKEVEKSITMADGPAGIRIIPEYGVDKKGIYKTEMDPLMEHLIDFIPRIARPFVFPKKNRKGEIHHQYTTAIPIGTALAQSFNDEFVYGCGEIVKSEMKMFGVDLWLAPALNIHRNILCGRNFEYYSEDPYLSGRVAISMIKGVEDNSGLGVTIKHFSCNNQENNRNNNNSHVSERALREIYLKGFEMCIKDANPKAIMTSYNLLNGVHTSESFELVNDILRCEWDYTGLVMTDWIASGRSFCKRSKYGAPYASNNILAGNDLTMPGCPKDYKDIMKALKKGKLTKEDLIYSASRIYRSIETMKK